jgi:hypothetical protein
MVPMNDAIRSVIFDDSFPAADKLLKDKTGDAVPTVASTPAVVDPTPALDPTPAVAPAKKFTFEDILEHNKTKREAPNTEFPFANSMANWKELARVIGIDVSKKQSKAAVIRAILVIDQDVIENILNHPGRNISELINLKRQPPAYDPNSDEALPEQTDQLNKYINQQRRKLKLNEAGDPEEWVANEMLKIKNRKLKQRGKGKIKQCGKGKSTKNLKKEMDEYFRMLTQL